MTPDSFRRIALSMPEASESAHMGHPDFRVNGKIFATLSPPGKGWGMVKLKPEQQQQLVAAQPDVFAPCQGAWGRQGCTYVQLRKVNRATLRNAMVAAWRNTAPKRLVD